ncbi:transporter [Longibacter salinarum]|uniref:Transporter n=1 Tax=Longibacter salinarum TaxID=1850348 RepID=A0A2A8CUW0_9BACT|nr:aspartate:alanine exchanger family transporter [Longibacter salinarum]PEN12250.1 transporter [Longibacter salinarum]
MIDFLVETPILLLVLVSALGYLLGQIKVKGSSLGVAAVLFVGLAFGALDPRLGLPEFTTLLGLILFVYAVGLSSGPGFFAALRRKGVRDNTFVVGMLAAAALLTAGLGLVVGLPNTVTSGLFTGSLTNTPALAALLERIEAKAPPELVETMLSEPVVGYSITYPVGIAGVILAIVIAQKVWKIDYAEETDGVAGAKTTGEDLESVSILVTNQDIAGATVRDLMQRHDWDVIFGRIRVTGAGQELVEADTVVRPGSVVSVVGTRENIAPVVELLGEPARERLEKRRHEYDFRRIFVSNPDVTGRPIRDLRFLQQVGAIVTRVRRGDVEWLATGDTVLELGDRVRVVARPSDMPLMNERFGDSYKALSEVNLFTLSVGIMAGMLIGLIPIPLPGGLEFKLGLAGGPLIAGLILGNAGRTGPLVWYLPYNANLLLRQLGLVLFFAGVGTKSGYAFFNTLMAGGTGLVIFGVGAVITCVTALTALWIGYRMLKIPMGVLVGMLAGIHTQPAVLSYAVQQSGSDLPNLGYATTFPMATIAKILFAQLLLLLL